MSALQVFDIIFAGGGTTACVVAGRLAAADPSLKILVVEAGQHSRDNPKHVMPCRYIDNVAPDSTSVYFHVAKPSASLDGRAPVVQSGRAVGGGSAVNWMFYARGAASDYDDWAAFGNKGWSFNEVLPFIKKLETFTPIPNRPTHGYSGPVKISPVRTDIGIGKQFLEVARLYDPCRPHVDDGNDLQTPNCYAKCHRYIDPETGKRCDAASRYLYPQSENPNLEIRVGKRVKRVIIENGRAVGIEYSSSEMGSGELVTVKASKLVVLSAGAFGSPTILERSGVGSPSVLEKNGVSVLVDLPGVGENYLDHIGTFLAFYASDEVDTMDDIWSDPERIDLHLKEWKESGTGKLSRLGIEAYAKLRTSAKELESAGPALKSMWKTFFEPYPDKPMVTIVAFSGFPLARPEIPGQRLMSVFYNSMYPDSCGRVHITSGEDPNAPYDFDPDYGSQADIELFALMYKFTRELFRRMPAYRGEIPATHPNFPAGSAAACRVKDAPVPIDAPNIEYSPADDEAIDKFHRDTLKTVWHSLGTCAMKPRDQFGVVDSRLNVYGIAGLKVADLSICPSNVGNNTYSTALLVGEKAAAIIAEDLGLKFD